MNWKVEAEFLDKVNPSVTLAKFVFSYLLKEFPAKKLSDVADTTSGGTPNRSFPTYYGGDIPWIKSGELNDGLITEFEETITEEGLKNSSAKIYPKGTLVLALYGATAGKTGILNFASASNQAVAAIYHRDVIAKEYLFWFFRQKRSEYIEMSFGAAQPNISQSVVKTTILPVPTLKVQNEIVDFLNHYQENAQLRPVETLNKIWKNLVRLDAVLKNRDSLLGEINSQLSNIQLLRQAILREAVQGKLVPQDPNDEPASELLKRIKAEKEKLAKKGKTENFEPIPDVPYELPKGWVWCRLGDVVTNHGQKTPRECFTYIDISSIDNVKGEITPNVQILSSDNAPSRARKIVKMGDVIYSTIRPYSLNIAMIENEFKFEPIASTAFAVMKPAFGLVNKYLYYYLRSSPFVRYVESQMVGLAYPAINDEKLFNGIIAIPPTGEQKRIVAKVHQLMQLCDELGTQVQQSKADAEKLLQAVLKEAFEGKTKTSSYDVSDEEDAPLTMAAEV